LRISIDEPEQLPLLPAAVEAAAYRIVLEALNNVVRHADACNCVVCLVLDGQAEELNVEVVDDGKGIADDHSTGVGLSSMRERAVELGGSFEVGPLPSGGTRVRVRLPCVSEDGTGDGKPAGSNAKEV
jgi:signal transduction histidine kinase